MADTAALARVKKSRAGHRASASRAKITILTPLICLKLSDVYKSGYHQEQGNSYSIVITTYILYLAALLHTKIMLKVEEEILSGHKPSRQKLKQHQQALQLKQKTLDDINEVILEHVEEDSLEDEIDGCPRKDRS